MTVELMMRLMTAEEFEEWWQFHQESPIDDESVHHTAVAKFAAMWGNAQRDPKKQQPAMTIRDCMPWFALGDFGEAPESSAEDMTAKMQAFTKLHNQPPD